MNKLISLVSLLFALMIVGCVTGPDGSKTVDVDRVARVAQTAAAFGTKVHLAMKPADRPIFVAVSNALAAMDASGDYDPLKFADALSALPVRKFQGEKGSMLVEGAVLLWDELSASSVKLDNTVWVKPVLKAVKTGLDQGLAYVPPAN